MILHIIKGGF